MQRNRIGLIGNGMGSVSIRGSKPKQGSAPGPLTLTTGSSPVFGMAKISAVNMDIDIGTQLGFDPIGLPNV